MEPFGEGGHQVSDFLCVIGVVTRLLEHPTLRISQVSILVLAPPATLDDLMEQQAISGDGLSAAKLFSFTSRVEGIVLFRHGCVGSVSILHYCLRSLESKGARQQSSYQHGPVCPADFFRSACLLYVAVAGLGVRALCLIGL